MESFLHPSAHTRRPNYGYASLSKLLKWREINVGMKNLVQRDLQGHGSLIERLAEVAVLKGHGGCVNTLAWNSSGSLLASGSDDTKVVLWDYSTRKALHTINTGHSSNIFGVCFIPGTDDNIIATGSMDYEVRIHYAPFHTSNSRSFKCHTGRVKEVKSTPHCPSLFWSVSEDSTVRQFDIRDLPCYNGQYSEVRDTPSSGTLIKVVIDSYSAMNCRAMGMTIHPLDATKFAVACGDQFIREYDRRMLRIQNTHATGPNTSDIRAEVEITQPIAFYSPPHMTGDQAKRHSSRHGTSVQYSSTGEEILVSYHNDHIYLFNTRSQNVSGEISTGENYDNKLARNCNQLQCHLKLKTPRKIAMLEDYQRKASVCSKTKKYNHAVEQYSSGICLCEKMLESKEASNIEMVRLKLAFFKFHRAISLTKREWEGDVFMAMLDCKDVLKINPTHEKAHFLLVQVLNKLGKSVEMKEEALLYKKNHPKRKEKMEQFLLERRRNRRSNSEDEETKGDSDDYHEDDDDCFSDAELCEDYRDDPYLDDADTGKLSTEVLGRYIGYCNMQTDIKEAKFFGENDSHIVSGSDDGRVYIWERSTGRIVNSFVADRDIVNCVQCHPHDACLATSGIEDSIRLWMPTGTGCSDKNYLDYSVKKMMQFEDLRYSNQDKMKLGAGINFIQPMDANIIRLFMQQAAQSGEDAPPQCTQS